MAIVVDASAVAAVIFSEPGGDSVAQKMHGEQLFAPRMLDFELANVCLKKIKTDPARQATLISAFTMLPRLSIDVVDVDLAAAIRLAVGSRLTAYDAMYLWLARTLDTKLLTLDRRLDAAHRDLRR